MKKPQMKRETLSKKIRFEVFKRDKFTCQYCGAKSPEVILNVDHIDPVAKGGKNDILNLITSCFDCNSGKSDRILNDSSIVEKQRKQLELLQERREQIELMLEWKKSLSNLDEEVNELIVDYVDSKIKPLYLTEEGKSTFLNSIKKFETQEILDAIDIAAKKYLKNESEEIFKASAELFLNKISGVIVVQSLPPISQKIAYIKGIARNRFYWNEREGSMILNNYVKALEEHYSEQQILNDLENEIIKLTKQVKNWTEWKNTIENWTADIYKWEKKASNSNSINEKEYSIDYLETFAHQNYCEQRDVISAIEYIAKIFPRFDSSKFRNLLKNYLIVFLKTKNDFVNGTTEREKAKLFIDKYIHDTELVELFHYEYEETPEIIGILMVLEGKVYELLNDAFMLAYFPVWNMKKEYLQIIIDLSIKALEEQE